MAQQILEIHLFGGLRILFDGNPLPPLPTRKSILLLAYLALQRDRSVERGQIARLLWPDLGQGRARRSLNTELWRLRRALGGIAGVIRAEPTSLSFNPQVSYLADFELFSRTETQNQSIAALTQAVQAYTGEFLAGFTEEWVLREQIFYREKYLSALAQLVRLHRDEGELPQAIHYARQILLIDPLREEIHRGLIQLLLDSNQRAAALRQYRHCAEILATELGVSPMPKTEALYRAILSDAPQGRETRPAVPRPVLALQRRFPFTGRNNERALLDSAWQQVKRGQVKVVLMSGEPGVGKTRLANEWLQTIRERGFVVKARFYQRATQPPLASLLAGLQEALNPRNLSGLAEAHPIIQSEISHLFPDVVFPWDDQPPEIKLPSEQARQWMYAAITTVLQFLSSPHRPLLLYLDDLHWADPGTLDLLSYTLENIQIPLLLLGNFRSSAYASVQGLFLPDWIARLETKGQPLTKIELAPLSRQETLDLVWQITRTDQPPGSFSDNLFWETGGNPLFLLETLKTLLVTEGVLITPGGAWTVPLDRVAAIGEIPLPSGIREIIQWQAERLPRDSRDFLTLAAVIGRQFDLELLLLASRQEEERMVDHLLRLRQAGLIREISGATAFEFSHDKVQEVIYHTVPEAQRRFLHKRVARALEGFPARVRQVEALAYHFSRSNEPAQALQYLHLALERAVERHDYRSGIALCNQALEILRTLGRVPSPQQFDFLIQRWTCELILADKKSTSATTLECVQIARQLKDDTRLGQALYAHGFNQVSQGDWESARVHLEESLSLAEQNQDLTLLANAHRELGSLSSHCLDTAKSIAQYRLALQAALRTEEIQLIRRARLDLAIAELPIAQQAEEYLQVFEEARRDNDWQTIFSNASNIIITLLMAGRPGDALREGTKYLQIAQNLGIQAYTDVLIRALSRTHNVLGNYEHAGALARQALVASRKTGYTYGEMRAWACLAVAAAGLGEPHEAIDALHKALELSEASGAWRATAVFHYLGAEICLYAQEEVAIKQAIQHITACLEISRTNGFLRGEMIALAFQAFYCLREGEVATALDASTRSVELETQVRNPASYEPLVWFAHAQVLRASNLPGSEEHLRRARDLLAQRARNIHDRKLRRSFLLRVLLHREICRNRVSL